ncbi:iron ABC transporter permease [Chromobacterium sp. IIBBL 290-4]|nr:iron ABC transporter permease [Chromobacterium sp. IIBBL 290-4]UTH74079.1 iron ABC transporter permease [Chromobacterium sp. IIBBL 290-4]
MRLSSLLQLHPQPELEWQLLLQLRLPRLLAAASSGMLLASAGCAIQARFRNALAEPGLIGINSGAALAAAAALSLGCGLYGTATAGFCGGLAALLLVRLLGDSADGNRLILSGLAVGTLLGSLLTLLVSTLPDGSLRVITFWLMGSFASIEWPQALIMLTAAPLIWLVLFSRWRFLNALQLGEDTAYHLGFSVRRQEWLIVLLSSLAAGIVVSACGMIGFVGLMAPHLARQLIGGDSKRLLLIAPLLGAWLTVLADAIAGGLLAPAELPVGVITSLLGAPFFLWLLRKQGHRHA